MGVVTEGSTEVNSSHDRVPRHPRFLPRPRRAWAIILVPVAGIALWYFAQPRAPRVVRIPCAEGTFPGRIPPPEEPILPASDRGCVYIDSTGQVVMRPPTEMCYEFIDGFAPTLWGDFETQWGYLARDGTGIRIDGLERVEPPSEGMALIRVPANRVFSISWKFGYVDLVNATVPIPPKYDNGGEFSEGLARVNRGASNWNRGYITGGRWGYVDRAGNEVIPITLHGAGDFSEGLAPAATAYARWGYIDRAGAWVIPPQFESAEPFLGGLARVGRGDKTVFVGRDGNVVVTPEYRPMEDYAEGLARVMAEEENDYMQSFIGRSGALAIPLQFAEVKSFSEGLSAVSFGLAGGQSSWGFIDKSGTFIIEPRFYYAESFRGGLARVSVYLGDSQRKRLYIDRTGQQIWPPTDGASGN